MNSDNDNSIFFLTISLVCVWLIVDYVVGKQYVGKFISMLPFMGGDGQTNAAQRAISPDSTEREWYKRCGLSDEDINKIPAIVAKEQANGEDSLTEDEKRILNVYKFVSANLGKSAI